MNRTAEPALGSGDPIGELEHTFLGDVPLPTWRRYLDGSRPTYLADHRVMNSNVFPGAGYVEMALATGLSLYGPPFCVAEQIQFEAPAILRAGTGYLLDTTFDQITERVAIYGRQPDSAHWMRHASARLAPAAVAAPVVDLDAIRARCGAEQDGGQFYTGIRGHGFDYGPAFRPIARLWLGEGEALGEFRPNALFASAGDDLVLNPVALDGCFQMLLALISTAVEEHTALLPVGGPDYRAQQAARAAVGPRVRDPLGGHRPHRRRGAHHRRRPGGHRSPRSACAARPPSSRYTPGSATGGCMS